jgi:hypothetical protein
MSNTDWSFEDASLLADEPAMTETAESTSSALGVEEEEEEEEEDKEESLGGAGKMTQDLFRSDNAKVNAVLDDLNREFLNDKENCDTFTAWGGGAALVHLLKNLLKRAMKKAPACDQVSELNELVELTTLHKTLNAITSLTYHSETGRAGITTVGGVEAAVKAMKTFPKCQALQEHGCAALRNLASYSIVKAKAIESGVIEVLLAAVIMHLGSATVCENACGALVKNVDKSKENTWLLINLGGGAVVAKVTTKWPDNTIVQTDVRRLAQMFGWVWTMQSSPKK